MSEHHEQELIERIARELRAGVRFDAAFDARVMAAVREGEAPAREADVRQLHRERPWLLRPRAVRVTPLAGLAAAAGFTMIVATSTLLLRSDAPATNEMAGVPAVASATPVDTQTVRVVQFVLRAPDAASVSLVGDFNEWDPRATPLHAVSRDGTWSVSLPLAPGRHVYAFVIDGQEWRPDPDAPAAPGDDFGVPNSVITVAPGAGATSS